MSVYMVQVVWLLEQPDTIEVSSVNTDGTAESTHVSTVAEAEALLAAAMVDFDADRTAAINALVSDLDIERANLVAHLGT